MLNQRENRKSGRAAARRAGQLVHKAALETLEQRLLLSVAVVQEGASLFIKGDKTDDAVDVMDLGGGNVVVTSPDPDPTGVARPMYFNGVASIFVDTAGGNDSVSHTAQAAQENPDGTALFDTFAAVSVNTGEGSDRFFLKFDGIKGKAAVKVELGAGDDSADLHVIGSLSLNYTKIEFSAGKGNDSVKGSFFDVFTEVSIDLGEGDDTLKIDAATAQAEEVSFNYTKIEWRAGAGNDTVEGSFFDVFADIAGDMGAGDDVAHIKWHGSDKAAVGDPTASQSGIKMDLSAGDGNDAILIGLLLPAVQKVREAAAHIDLGAGNDTIKFDAASTAASLNFAKIKLNAGSGRDSVDMAFRDVFVDVAADLGSGDDSASFRAGYIKIDDIKGETTDARMPDVNLDISAGDGNDDVTVGLLLPAVQKIREAAARISLGSGNDKLKIKASNGDEPGTLKGLLKMKVDAGSGNDSVDGSFFDVFTELSADLGSGNDSAAVDVFLKIPDIKGEFEREDAGFKIEIGAASGNDTVQINAQGSGDAAAKGDSYHHIKLKLDAGSGNDVVRGTFTDVFVDASIDLGSGNDSASLRAGYHKLGDIKGEFADREGAGFNLDISAGDGNDAILIGLLLPAVQKIREAAARVSLGDGNDTFEIDAQGSGDAAAKGDSYHHIKLKLDAGSGNDVVRGTFTDVFTDASLNLGSGNDSASLRSGYLKIGDIKGGFADREGAGFNLDISAGDGNDAILIGLLLPAVQKVREAAARIDLGDGNDTMAADIITGAGPGGGPHVKVFAGGGAGNDTIETSFAGVSIELDLDGGSGNDRISADGKLKVLPAPNNVSSRLHLSGGDGDDVLTLKLAGDWTDPRTGESLMDALVDGGDGRDTAYVSAGVKIVNVEKVFDLSPPKLKKVFRR